MKSLLLLGISALFLTGCGAESQSKIEQLETHDGYLVECVSVGAYSVDCDWEHQVKK